MWGVRKLWTLCQWECTPGLGPFLLFQTTAPCPWTLPVCSRSWYPGCFHVDGSQRLRRRSRTLRGLALEHRSRAPSACTLCAGPHCWSSLWSSPPPPGCPAGGRNTQVKGDPLWDKGHALGGLGGTKMPLERCQVGGFHPAGERTLSSARGSLVSRTDSPWAGLVLREELNS